MSSSASRARCSQGSDPSLSLPAISQPLRLDVKRVLFQRSDRVKGVDLHPTEPWLLANLYNGSLQIWNYVDQTLVKSFEVTDLPVRTSKFIARKQWIAAGSDDMMVRVFNYNTMDKVSSPLPVSRACAPDLRRPRHPTDSVFEPLLRSKCSRRTRITFDPWPFTRPSPSF